MTIRSPRPLQQNYAGIADTKPRKKTRFTEAGLIFRIDMFVD